MGIYAKFFYQTAVVENLQVEWPGILEDRLMFSAQAVSTAIHMGDKAWLDSVNRLKILYEDASSEPYPIRADSFDLARPEDLSYDTKVYGRSAYCNTDGGVDWRRQCG